MVFRKLFERAASEPRQHRLPDSERIYAVGDIHGRRDCLDVLIDRIDADDRARDGATTTLLFLGDLTDRGPDSRGVVDRVMEIAAGRRCVLLTGNHEEILVGTWDGDRSMAGLFNRVGGRETLLSYGATEAEYDACDLAGLAALTARVVPAEHIAFLRGFVDSHAAGDYLFVHAGIRPGVPLDAQTSGDMRWIRREFLDDRRDHGPMIVHGHSITEAVDARANRIGIDTGAYASGRLTAIGIEGGERWFLQS